LRPVNFSDLDREDGEGNLLIFEPENKDAIGQSNHIPGFWFNVCSELSGIETLILFLLYAWDMTQEETADYLNISRSYVAKITRKARKKLSKSKYLLKITGQY